MKTFEAHSLSTSLPHCDAVPTLSHRGLRLFSSLQNVAAFSSVYHGDASSVSMMVATFLQTQNLRVLEGLR